MYLIVGLGNPGKEYEKTRHNMGFHTIDNLSQQWKISLSKHGFDGVYGIGYIEEKKVFLLKPETYMNLSGNSIKKVVEFYHIAKEDIIVIYDDIDLEAGIIKIRKKGGPGTHNGMKSVISQLQTEEFARIRIGIGSPEYKGDLIHHVIGQVKEEEYQLLDKACQDAANAINDILKKGIDKAMNQYN